MEYRKTGNNRLRARGKMVEPTRLMMLLTRILLSPFGGM